MKKSLNVLGTVYRVEVHKYKRDLISHILSLSYRHERDIKDALYTPTPSCTFKAEEGV